MGLGQKRGLAREESATRLEGSARGTTLSATTRVVMGMVLGFALLSAGCDTASGGGASRTSGRHVDGAEARRLVEVQGALLLDVRTDGEWSSGHVDGATHIPVQDLAARLTEVPADRPVVVYCASGVRSARAVEILRAEGREAFDLGSMSDWPDG